MSQELIKDDRAEPDQQALPQSRGVLTKVLSFSVGLTLVFTLVANLLPQVEGEAPVDEVIDLGALTPESFAALGEKLFMGKGTCTLCHKPPPLGRAPDIQGENMVGLAEERLADERYQGEAKNTQDYILESLIAPSTYVVKDWGVAGSDDTVSPMPKVNAAPIELTTVEMDAIIAYLQHKDGNDITVELPTESPAIEEQVVAAEGGAPAPALSAQEAIKKYGCQACHSLLGSSSPVGPALDDIGTRLDREQLQQSILDPAAVISEGFGNIMPTDFAQKMTVNELNMIVDLLAASNGDSTQTSDSGVDSGADSAEAASTEPVMATETSNEEVAQ